MVFEGMVEGMLNPAGKDADYNFLRILLNEHIKQEVRLVLGIGKDEAIRRKKGKYFCAQLPTLGIALGI